MTDLIVGLILLLVLGGAALYIYRAKKKGAKCIGCPYGSTCGKSGGCNCGCGK